jgi:hypothetical protein
MRQLHAIVIVAMALFASAAQTERLEVSESTVDFGTIQEGPPVVKKIILTNRGAQPLTIANATAS